MRALEVMRQTTRPLAAVSLAAAALLMSGCAALNTLTSQVSTYGTWPADRPAGTYAFDRLPSQQAQVDTEEKLEAMAKPALESAGFKPVAAGATPDVLVQLGARTNPSDRSPWNDPLWVHPWGPRWRLMGDPWGPGWWDTVPPYEREVAVLIRDRATGQALYEARAATDGSTPGGTAIFTTMFMAAMKEFPKVDSKPHAVSATLP